MIQLKCVSSLTRVFPYEEPKEDIYDIPITLFSNETFSLQCAYTGDGSHPYDLELQITSYFNDCVHVREVVLVPSLYPAGGERDDKYENTKAGLFPDVLRERKKTTVHVIPGQWRSVWIEIDGSKIPEAGSSPLLLKLLSKDLEESVTKAMILTKIEGKTKEQSLKHTEWFYSDCLADYYNVPAWSKEHWEIIKKFLTVYKKRGMNTILTPIITLSLDILPGKERTTTQLLTITANGEEYEFNFDRLNQWIDLCQEAGIENFEMAHLYTQWGAACAPKIVGFVDGEEKELFGWSDSSLSERYQKFLSIMLTKLTDFLMEKGLWGRVYFHVSDEPSISQMEHYLKAKDQIQPYIKGFPIIDALSDYEFYESKALDHPIPAEDHITPFMEHKVPGLWTYYCSAQKMHVSNRFFSMPLSRTRILGVQLYKYQIEGFLHWGFNFYNSQLSVEHINPYQVTDCGGCFPSGDGFLVYPGIGGEPEESIRLIAMADAVQDIRAFETLEALAGRDFVLSMIEEGLEEEITFTNYPIESEYLLNLRLRVNKEIQERTTVKDDDWRDHF